jgi:hypothetical protein
VGDVAAGGRSWDSSRMAKKTETIVYVVDAWDDDAQESYVKVFSTRDKAVRVQ